MNIPTNKAKIQNQSSVGANKIPVPSINNANNEKRTVLNGPILSSKNPPAIAPIPQNKLTAIAKIITFH